MPGILYLECNMGAAGDMLAAALYELLDDAQQKEFLQRMNAPGLPGLSVRALPSVKCGIAGTRMQVLVNGAEESAGDAHVYTAHGAHSHSHASHAHAHYSLEDVTRTMAAMALPEEVRRRAAGVYRRIAEAESRVHGMPVEEVHFHEVGALDAIADVAGACLALYLLSPDRVLCSPVHVGCGETRCAHGILPVPAPATELLLRGIPIYGGQLRGELCTPTGAALLAEFADDFGSMPVMVTERVGCGMGMKDFEQANCLRAILGHSFAADPAQADENIVELVCNIDDMTGEELGFAAERLVAAGALDVYTTAIGMKKNRPGTMLTCMCSAAQKDVMLRELFRHTTTLGVREYFCARYRLARSESVREDADDRILHVKRAEGYGVCREKLEYEDLAGIARARGISLREARAGAESSAMHPASRCGGAGPVHGKGDGNEA